MLSAIGLFGLTSYAVARRMKEIALRVALGAAPGHILRLLFGRVVGQIVLGLALGVAGAYGLGRLLGGILVQTTATDPLVLAGVGLVLVMVAVGTCIVPARRAIGVQPVMALLSNEP